MTASQRALAAVTLAWVVLVHLAANAQQVEKPLPVPCASGDLSPRDRFILGVASPALSAEQTRQELAKRGYFLAPSGVFEKLRQDAVAPAHVELTSEDTDTLERELNDAAIQGYSLVADSLFKTASGRLGAVIVKRPLRSTDAEQVTAHNVTEYRIALINGAAPRDIERVVLERARRGFTPAAIRKLYEYDRDGAVEAQEVAFIFQRTGEAASRSPEAWNADRFRVLTKESALPKEIRRLSQSGYQLKMMSRDPIVVLERTGADTAAEYEVVRPTTFSSRNPAASLQRDFSVAASRGFRLRRDWLFESRTRGPLWVQSVGAIMEKPNKPTPQPEYLVIDAYRMGALEREFAAALEKGFVPIARFNHHASVIVMERPHNCRM